MDNNLGAYLRARRELQRPEDVGLRDDGAGRMRRVRGLRREEVAMLAGISVDYYVRLEQGRDLHPSEQVLESIGCALMLDDDAKAYLLALGHPKPVRSRPRRPERVSVSIQRLIDGWSTTAAFVQGRYLDNLAANTLAVGLSPFHAPGINALRATFLQPEAREFYRNWDEVSANVVPYVRSIAGADIDDPRLTQLVGELSMHSERFRTLWARHDVKYKTSGTTLLMHPQVGALELHYEKLALPGTNGQMLVTYHATPGGESFERLSLLASLSATQPFGGASSNAHTTTEQRALLGRPVRPPR
jgi:transcriptional regulator with XRE-family HTH domain